MTGTIIILVVGSFTLLVSSSCQATAFHFIPHLHYHHHHHSTTISSYTTSSTTMSSNGGVVLNRVTPDQVALEIKDPVDPSALVQARAILDELVLTTTTTTSTMVQEEALLTVAKRLGDLPPDATSCIVTPEECQAAYEGLTETERTALSNIYHRIKTFAEMQRRSVVDMEMDIPGGKAGHTVSPCRGESFWMIVYVCVRERLGCGFGFGLDCHKSKTV